MKNLKQATALALVTMAVFSCNNAGDRTASDRTDSAANISTAPVENSNNDTIASSGTQPSTNTGTQIDATPLDNSSAGFATEAASGGMMEVTLGQLAQQKATNQRVKDFGAMMVSDHTKANTDLKNITDAKSFQLPASLAQEHQHHIDKLSKKEGADFDKAYMKMMTEDHVKDIRAFEKAANSSSDPAVKEFANKTLPVLRTHLDSARAILKSLK